MYMSRILIQNATKWQRATGDSTDSLRKVDTLTGTATNTTQKTLDVKVQVKNFQNQKLQYRADVTNTSRGGRTEVAHGDTRPKRKLEGRPAYVSDAQAIMAEMSNAQPRCRGVGLATNRKPFSKSNRHATSVII